MEDRCVMCGRIIPEGRQICPICEKGEPKVESPKWILVKDRLPEESGEYLTYCGEYDGICVLYYEVLKTKGKWRTKWKDDVTHWMPLPEPPKGE